MSNDLDNHRSGSAAAVRYCGFGLGRHPIGGADVSDNHSSVAICCFHAATMLEIADSSEPDALKRGRMQEANAGQARLLRNAGDIADEMLATLREVESYLDDRADVDDGIPNDAMRLLVDVQTVIRKARVRKP